MKTFYKTFLVMGANLILGGCADPLYEDINISRKEKLGLLRVAVIDSINNILIENHIHLGLGETCLITTINSNTTLACKERLIIKITSERSSELLMQVFDVPVTPNHLLDTSRGCISVEYDGEGEESGPDCEVEIDRLPGIPHGQRTLI